MLERFGRYELLERIGAGGMAEVFRARLVVAPGAEKVLAIKRILPALSADPELLRLFVNEARIATSLAHGNLVGVFEFGEVDGNHYLAMEHVHGQNLAAVLQRARARGGRLPPALSLLVASEVAKGLAHAHGSTTAAGDRVQVVHRDVSPQNILISYDGAVKLTDFGIAQIGSGFAPAEHLRGKAAYLAPEIAAGAAVDGRADVWALGAVLYECLTGAPPHAGSDDAAVLAAGRSAAVLPPSREDRSLARYDELLLRALAPNPGNRHAGAREFQVALARALFADAPEIDGPELGTWMRGAFASELREHARPLLLQRNLADEPTAELPDPSTIAVPGPAEASAHERGRRWRIAAALCAAALALAAGVALVVPSPRPPPAPAPSAAATLSVHSWPSAAVQLNGHALPGRTPHHGVEVEPGRHTLLFERPELGLRKAIVVDVAPGSSRAIAVTLDR